MDLLNKSQNIGKKALDDEVSSGSPSKVLIADTNPQRDQLDIDIEAANVTEQKQKTFSGNQAVLLPNNIDLQLRIRKAP